MSNNYFYKQRKVRKHDRHTPKTKKIITIGAYDRKQRYRNYAKFSRERAQELFDQRSQRAKTLDLKTTSKKVFKIPNEYWEKYMGRSDVEGIDTKQKIKKSKISEVFYQDFFDHEEKQRNIREIESKILRCRHEINYFETYHKSALKSDDWNTIKKKYNNWKKELKENEEKLKKTQFIWQKEPSNWYYHEEDPRYTKMKNYIKEDISGIKQQIRVLKGKLDNTYIRSAEKYEYTKDIEKKSEELELLDAKLKKIEAKPRELYWDDNLIEATIKRGKKLPYPVRKVMPEKYKQQYEYMTKRTKDVEEARSKHQEIKIEKKRAKREALERERKQDVQKLNKIKEVMKNQFRTKIEREAFEDWEISELGEGRKGLLDPARITILMTNTSFKGSVLDQGIKKRQDIGFDIEKTPFRFSKYGDKFYDFKLKDGSEIWFSKEYVDRAINSFKNPRVYINKEEARPMVIQDDTYTYAIAPRIDVDDPEWWDEKSLIPGGIRLTPKKYREKMKITKAEMIKRGNLDKDLLKKNKDYVLFEYLKTQKLEV